MISTHSEVVEAEGHLIDSQILNVVFDHNHTCSDLFNKLPFINQHAANGWHVNFTTTLQAGGK